MDIDGDNKYVLLDYLKDEGFKYYLRQSEMVFAISQSFNDIDYSVRIKALNILGPLLPLNPAVVIMPIRKLLIQLCRNITIPIKGHDSDSDLKVICEILNYDNNNYFFPFYDGIFHIMLRILKECNRSIY